MVAQPTPAHPAIIAHEAQVEAQASAQSSTQPTSSTPVAPLSADSPLPSPIFQTARLHIRPLHPQDAPSMAQHGNNPAVTQYMSLTFPSPYTQEAARVWINMNRTPPFLNWGICEASAPEIIIGGLGLKPGSDVQAHTAEFGFWVGEAFWGKGYGSEALEGLTEWCFTGDFRMGEKKVKRLWAVVFEGNKGSMRCFEKCGYFPEGVMKGAVEKWGKVLDLYIFGLTKTDWEARRARRARTAES